MRSFLYLQKVLYRLTCAVAQVEQVERPPRGVTVPRSARAAASLFGTLRAEYFDDCPTCHRTESRVVTPEQAAALRKAFPPSAVGQLHRNMRTGEVVELDYVGHAAVTDRLLAVDPSWTWEPVAHDEHGLPATDGRNLWIRLTVCGVTRLGVGDGASIKEAIGDAIRNAAMRFGVALDLWSKEELEQAQDPQPSPAPAPPGPAAPEPSSSAVTDASRPPAAASAAARAKMFALVGELDRDDDSAWSARSSAGRSPHPTT